METDGTRAHTFTLLGWQSQLLVYKLRKARIENKTTRATTKLKAPAASVGVVPMDGGHTGLVSGIRNNHPRVAT